MQRDAYIQKLIENHKRLMAAVDQDSPPVTLTARLIEQREATGARLSVFAVASTTRPTKLAALIEQRVFVEGKEQTSGTVIDAYDDKIVVLFKRRLSLGQFSLRVYANYNNEVLLQAAEAFLASKKAVHPCLLSHTAEEPLSIQKGTAMYSGRLNKSQQSAVLMARNGEPFKILGPPGTGKTETVVEIIIQALCRDKSVIVCGPSNISVDNIITRFMASDYYSSHGTSFYRLGSSTKGLCHLNLESRADQAVAFMEDERDSLATTGKSAKVKSSKKASRDNRQELKQLDSEKSARRLEFINKLRTESPLVFATLFSSLKENHYFDLCIVDEACQATELECFMGIVKARTFILAGDPNQLCPANPTLYTKTPLPTVTLAEQYRMHEELMDFSNGYFYDSAIISNKRDDFNFFEKSRILFIDTAFFGWDEAVAGSSKQNPAEARLVADVVRWLSQLLSLPAAMQRASLKSGAQSKRKSGDPDSLFSIGVITAYSAQVLAIQELLGDLPNCSVNTVDGFQGQEKDFIVLSLVRSNSTSEIGFLSDEKRLNVALTRCKKGLVLIGDSNNFKKNTFFRALFRHLNEHAYVVDPDTFALLIE
ncbi:hypothetical protein PAPHI01_0406 [Pancytospora philotis]|nr:hypothetical protein PAPHI01_0406 [Pancytospora philotis]